jgi:hypothetical protein
MTDYSRLIKRLLSASSPIWEASAAAKALEAQAKEIERLEEANVFCRSAFSSSQERIAELEKALKLMIDTQDEWEKSVSKVIGKQPSVFNRAIDTARAALHGEKG